MPTFVLTCIDHPDALERRMAARTAHLAYVAEHRSLVKLAGPLLGAGGEMAGSMFIMEAEAVAEVEAFAAADPYRQANVFERTEIRPFKITVGAIA